MGDRLVLCYHAVSDQWPSPLAVAPERLEEGLTFLARRGFRAGTFSETVTWSGGERRLAATFDDAFRSVYVHAFPVLQSLGMTATVFVPTALVGTGRPMSWTGIAQWLDGPYAGELTGMSWDELGELADAGWEIGSHTCRHARLTELDDATLADELRGSREECERRLGRRCASLAYPYGAVDARVLRAAGEAGYAAAAAPPNRLPGDLVMRWPRVGVYPDDDLRRLRLKVSPVVRRLSSSRAWAPLWRLNRLLH